MERITLKIHESLSVPAYKVTDSLCVHRGVNYTRHGLWEIAVIQNGRKFPCRGCLTMKASIKNAMKIERKMGPFVGRNHDAMALRCLRNAKMDKAGILKWLWKLPMSEE